MKAYGEVDIFIHNFLIWALAGGEWSSSCSCRFTPGENAPSIHWTGGWVGPRIGLNDLEKRQFLTLQGLELRTLSRPVRGSLLYRLCYASFSVGLVTSRILSTPHSHTPQRWHPFWMYEYSPTSVFVFLVCTFQCFSQLDSIVTDLLGALLGGCPGGRVLVYSPRNSTVDVFSSCPRVGLWYTTHAQVISQNRV
jgi:hypothetical protein